MIDVMMLGASAVTGPVLLTWTDLAPALTFVSLCFSALVGAIWNQHQKGLAALDDKIAKIEREFDEFRHQEIKGIQDAMNKRMDAIMDAIHGLELAVVKTYVPRVEFERAIERIVPKP